MEINRNARSRVPQPSKPKPRPPSPPPQIRNKRGDVFVTGKFLGHGGFARCYQATDHRGNVIAVKVVHKPSLKTTKQRSKVLFYLSFFQLLSEIKIHQALSHPCIVKFYTCFEDQENVYMMLELCEKGVLNFSDCKTFMKYLKTRGRLTEPEVSFYMYQLLDGIGYMHRNNYIHRDIKLGNLFLTCDMNMKIGDFGLATEIEHDGERKK